MQKECVLVGRRVEWQSAGRRGVVTSSKSLYIKTIYPYTLDHTPHVDFSIHARALSPIAFKFIFEANFKDFLGFLGVKKPKKLKF